MLRIPWKTIVGLFQEASIDPIVSELQIFIKRLPTKPARVILGGGYSTMSIVRDASFELDKEFKIASQWQLELSIWLQILILLNQGFSSLRIPF